jgi:hypothetical protein
MRDPRKPTPTRWPCLAVWRGRRRLRGWSKAKSELDQRIAAANGSRIAAWTLHDLRRTFVTQVSEHGIAPPHVVEAIVNHISGVKAGVAGVYNRATYLQEKRRSLDLWAAHVAALIDGRASNIVRFDSSNSVDVR